MRRHPKLPFLFHCETCKKFRDEELWDGVIASECSLCKRKRERIRLSLFDPKDHRSSGAKARYRRERSQKANFEKAFGAWKLKRRQELTEAGVPSWDHWQIIHNEAPKAKVRILHGERV